MAGKSISCIPLAKKASLGWYGICAPSTARIRYGVDHSAYINTLARDFGGAPGLFELWCTHGLNVPLFYYFGASFVTF